MITSVLGKALAATAAAAIVLIPSATTIAPQLANTAHPTMKPPSGPHRHPPGKKPCKYYDVTTTHTDLTLDKSVVKKGEKVTATVTVTSGNSTPIEGPVNLTVDHN